jgi:hypothetical protein
MPQRPDLPPSGCPTDMVKDMVAEAFLAHCRKHTAAALGS